MSFSVLCILVACQIFAIRGFSVGIKAAPLTRVGMTTQQMEDPITDSETWEIYKSALEDTMGRVRVLKKQSPMDVKVVQDYLLSNQVLVSPVGWNSDITSLSREDLGLQKELFLEKTGFSKRQVEYCTRCLTYLGDYCAEQQNPHPVSICWYKLRESGTLPRENCFSTYMYVLSLDERYVKDCFQVATFHDRFFEPNEKTVTLRIKLLIEQGDAAQAETILESVPDKGGASSWRRLRTFLPLLNYYADQGDVSAMLHLFDQMRQSAGVHFDADTYAVVISSLARNGCFQPDAPVISSLSSSGPLLFDEIASKCANDLLELNEQAANEISSAMCKGFEVVEPKEQEFPACRDTKGRIFVDHVHVNTTTAVCCETGVKLRLISLTNEQREQVHDTLLEMAASQHEEFGLKLKGKGQKFENRGAQFARDQLASFSKWLEARDPFTAFVDGPNVAYFGHSSVQYKQVQEVVNELERMGERPLVIMPQKYFAKSFRLTGVDNSIQQLSQTDVEIMNGLQRDGKMYIVPLGCLDDYYWMLASTIGETTELHVPDGDDRGRLPGLRPMLITNDQMRDHRLSLLEPRLFRRWTSCHIVNYDIRSSAENDDSVPVTMRLFPADLFSREIQQNEDPTRSDGSMVWHFPITEWQGPDRLCVRIGRSEM
jgi:pentatricopeptide repeat protein